VERGGRLVARGQIVDHALGGDANDRSVDPHVSRLRQKLERLAPGVRLTSVRGEGYRLDLTP
jgi:DNA-binding response OmpR family regulator